MAVGRQDDDHKIASGTATATTRKWGDDDERSPWRGDGWAEMGGKNADEREGVRERALPLPKVCFVLLLFFFLILTMITIANGHSRRLRHTDGHGRKYAYKHYRLW
jgi:hypothetical protein